MITCDHILLSWRLVHFRFRGNSIQVVKSQRDPVTGRAKSVPLGSINRLTLGISAKLRANCTPDELKEIAAWVRHYQSLDALKHKHAALTLPEQIAAAIQWFKVADDSEARQIADDVLTTAAELRSTLNKRGLP
jgi:hypothetical protein